MHAYYDENREYNVVRLHPYQPNAAEAAQVRVPVDESIQFSTLSERSGAPEHRRRLRTTGSFAAISDIGRRPSAGRSRAMTGHPGARRLRLAPKR